MPVYLPEKLVKFTSFNYNPPVGDIRHYFYSMTAGIQQEQRNLWKHSFGRRNQSHKNRALNWVPLNRLLELYRNGHSTAGRALRGHAVFTRLQFRLNKVMLHFQPVLTTAFLKDTWYPHAPNAPLPHSAGDTFEEGRVWEGDEKWMSSVVGECVRGQTPGLHISVPSPHTTVTKCLWQCVFYILPGGWQSEWKSHTASQSFVL